MKTFILATAMMTPVAAAAVMQATPAEIGQERTVTTPANDEGRQSFAKYCARCHGTSGHGEGPVGDALRVRPPDLTLLAKNNDGVFAAARIERIIDGRDIMAAHGTMEMPVWGDVFRRREGLSEQAVKARIEAIVRYLASIQERSS